MDLLLVFSGSIFAQSTKAQLEVSETIFSVAAALNSCGYDAGLDNSLPLRQTIRAEVLQAVQKSEEAARAHSAFCEFRKEHQLVDASSDASQYLSLALDLGGPPAFAPVLLEADLPPDAAHVLGLIPLLQRFYQAEGLRDLWLKHQAEYNALVDRFHEPVSNVMTQTDLYLKLQFSSYPGRRFIIFLEPLLAPGQVNARNYGDNYYVVISPAQQQDAPELPRLGEIRHTYLHYVLDPLAQQHNSTLKRLEPLLESVRSAPLDRSYKSDISLLVNESLIRAIEARTLLVGKSNAEARTAYVRRSEEEGYILTRYFFDTLAGFEKESTGLKNAYGDFLYNINLDQEKKRAKDVAFAAQAAPEVVGASRPARHEQRSLDLAEQQMNNGNTVEARRLALQALNDPGGHEDPGHALFILARVATMSGDMESARSYFERAVQAAHDARTLAWSHIYLGRIFDIQENREEALAHYRAALAAGDSSPDTQSAAEKGLAAPYQPRSAPH